MASGCTARVTARNPQPGKASAAATGWPESFSFRNEEEIGVAIPMTAIGTGE